MAASLLDQMLFSPEAAQALARTRLRLRGGSIDALYVARIGQTHYGPGQWPPEQAAAYLRVHTGLATGEFAQVLLGVAGPPERDADRAGNQDVLATMHESFRPVLDAEQNGADADGVLWWDQNIIVDCSTGQTGEDGARPAMRPVSVEAGSAPLEVGVTDPSRTLMHLVQHGGVARWPYGHASVCLLLSLRPGHHKLRQQPAGSQ
ncbi:hypothetical protein [Streptomyces kronopolitis]|uniref:hypothetical protein n=1 Tax=Streptomyces kronopolitis TaxID=1612435 RepID=UPI0020BF5B60|nr:hypothetical protein [Streptomyces kronopolitis]MCL6302812.1 hypothetical protein [Streptomyces kronopolitis]